MTAATVRVPQPLIAVGVVVSDAVARILTVRLSENEKGYGRLLYRQAFQALVVAEETGRPHRAVWASAPGGDRVAFAVPGDNQTLLFHFPAGEPVYQSLVSKPGLTASVTLDRSTCRFLSVRFHHRRT